MKFDLKTSCSPCITATDSGLAVESCELRVISILISMMRLGIRSVKIHCDFNYPPLSELISSRQVSTTSIKLSNNMDTELDKYVKLASRNEDLKSDERVLNTTLDNLKEIKGLLLDKEKEFCVEDQNLRASCGRGSIKDFMRTRCFNLIDHLVHYKCIVECLATDILNMESNLIDDDEYVRLSLTYRDVELAILQAIKVNQQRNEVFLNMHDEEAQSYLSEIEPRWRLEHEARRKLISKLILDQSQFVIDKTTKNLEQQQALLNQRYQSINILIKMSYNYLDDYNNNTLNKINRA